MTITFFVGNGFDISAGLNTSYNGFYEWYTKRPSKTEAITKFKEEIDKYMHIEDPEERKKSRWADFEVALGEYTSEFTEETAEDFLDVYEDAHEELGTYLEIERSKFDFEITDPDTLANLREGVRHFYQELKPVERDFFSNWFNNNRANDFHIKFISFNYTDALDAVVKELSKEPLETWQNGGTKKLTVLPSVLHIHGTTNNAPIVGVFNESQVANKELLNHPGVMQALIKAQSVRTAGERWYDEADKQISSSHIICIWGMSLGVTDARWWQRIVSWLRSNGALHLVVFWHMKESDAPTGRSYVRPYQIKQNVIDLLTAHSGLEAADKKALENRIHVVINTSKVLKVSFERSIMPPSDKEFNTSILGSSEENALATV